MQVDVIRIVVAWFFGVLLFVFGFFAFGKIL